MGGKSLEKFRLEYDKLHHTLKQSHENERRLIRRCRELNNEIAANATKIQTALRLSVQDQNSITLLKKELDKAWKMVDGAQEKEKRARETIQRLKVEIQNLSMLVDQGAGLSIGQENAVNELLKIKDDLTREVAIHTSTLERRTREIQELKQTQGELFTKIADLERQRAVLMDEKKQLQDQVMRERSEAMTCRTSMVDAQQSLEVAHQEKKQLEHALRGEKEKVEKLDKFARGLENEKAKLEVSVVELHKSKAELDKEKQALKTQEQTLKKDKSQVEQALEEKKKELLTAEEAVRAEEMRRKRVEKERDMMREKKNQAEKYKDWLRDQMKTVLASVKSQRDDAAVDEAMVKELQQHVKRLHHAMNLANQTNQDQYKLVEDSELIKKSLEDDILAHKHEEQALRKRNYQLEKQKEKHAMSATTWHAKFVEAQEQVKLKEMENHELSKQIVDERNKLRLQQTLYEQVRSDRNKFSKQQAQQKDDIAEMQRKFKIMSHQIEQLKEEVQNKDNALINEHFAYKRMQAEMKVARRKLAKRKEVLATADQVLSSQDAEIKALRRQVMEAEEAHRQQEHAYDELMQERDILGTQLIRRNDELALLYEKVRIQQSTLNKGEVQYRERLQDLRALKIAINNLKQELMLRSQEVTTVDALKNEVYHVQRELLQERTKVKALSEELENPMNVHRWRSLEGSDPKKHELIQKIQMLQRRLISKTEEAVGKDMRLEEKEKLYQALKTSVARQPGPELAQQLIKYQTLLKEKTMQMKSMAAELNMFQAQANEFKYKADRLSFENQDVKRKYFEQRRQVQVAKDSVRAKVSARDPLFQQQRAFFNTQPKIAGGGYNLSQTVPSAAAASTVPVSALPQQVPPPQ